MTSSMFSLSPFRNSSARPLREEEKIMAWLSGVQLSRVKMPRLSRVKRRGGFMLVPPGPNSAKYTSFQLFLSTNDRRFPSWVIVRSAGSKSLQDVSCSGLLAASPVLGLTRTCQRLPFVLPEGGSAV